MFTDEWCKREQYREWSHFVRCLQELRVLHSQPVADHQYKVWFKLLHRTSRPDVPSPASCLRATNQCTTAAHRTQIQPQNGVNRILKPCNMRHRLMRISGRTLPVALTPTLFPPNSSRRCPISTIALPKSA